MVAGTSVTGLTFDSPDRRMQSQGNSSGNLFTLGYAYAQLPADLEFHAVPSDPG